MNERLSDATRIDPRQTPSTDSSFEIRTSAGVGICRIAVRGESDVTSEARLRSTRARIDLDRTPHVQLSLSRLEFCDIGTARALIDLAYDVRAAGGIVSVTEPPPLVVRQMLRILDVADDLPLPPGPVHNGHRPMQGDCTDAPPL